MTCIIFNGKSLYIQEETIANYAMRMCEDILHKNPVLVGVSFGGIMAQEMSQFITTKKVILISSVKRQKRTAKKVPTR